MRKPMITILYDSAEEKEREEGGKQESLVCEQVQGALTDSGYQVKRIAVGRNIRDFAAQIDKDDSELIFNLCESLGGVSHFEQNVAALLEVLGKRFTGAGSMGLALAQDKALSKKIFSFHDIRYPRFTSIDAGEVEWSDDLSFPLFVKPLNQDASIGIDSGSIVNNVKELMERISYVKTEFNAPALIEEFIEGRELYIGILGNEKPEPLPILEWDFSRIPEGLPKIASSAAKWDEKSAYDEAPELFPGDLPETVYRSIQETAVLAYKSLKLRDYGRVDIRLRKAKPQGNQLSKRNLKAISKGGTKGKDSWHEEAAKSQTENWEFFVIEVNPNPYLDSKSEFAMAARKHGLSFTGLLEKIIELALQRNP